MSKLSNEIKDDESETGCGKDAIRPYVRHRENGYGSLYDQQATKHQEAMVSDATYAPPSSILKISGLGTDRPATLWRKDLPERIYIELMGPRPTEKDIWRNNNEQYWSPDISKYSVKEFPKWDGTNESKTGCVTVNDGGKIPRLDCVTMELP